MKVSPSLLAADFMNLSEEVKRIKESGCEYIHLDVMDGNFVPNISFGPGIISQLKQILDVPFDVHLMINNPRFYLNEFKKAGANILTYHYEVNDNHHELIKEIKDLGIKARSKESAAVQKYGEKEWVNNKGEVLKYGDEQLAKDFPNVETQEKIKNTRRYKLWQ